IVIQSSKIRAVVLLSGGMDSCVCAALAARDCEVAGLHISYGQRTEKRERYSVQRVCDQLGIQKRLIVRNEDLRLIRSSALTDDKIELPESHTVGRDILVTYDFVIRQSGAADQP